MNRIAAVTFTILALGALCVPPAHASDCDPDEVADVEKCVRGVKVPGIRQVLPPGVRLPEDIAEACDPDEVDDVAKCLREAGLAGIRRAAPQGEVLAEPRKRKAARSPEAPRQETVAKSEPEPAAAIAASEKPAEPAVRNEGRACQKYLPSIGQVVPVPCGE